MINEYEIIKMLLSSVRKSYEEGKMTPESYLETIESIEKDFLTLKRENREEDIRKILNKYITDLS